MASSIVDRGTGAVIIVKKVLNAEIDSLNRNIRLISKQHYLDALDLIASKKKLLIVGHQASEAPAVYASYCLSKVRTNVHRFDLSNSDVLGMSNSLSSDDVALVFAHPRYPIKTVQAIDIFNKYSVPIILVTHSENSPYVNKARVVLGISIRYHYAYNDLVFYLCMSRILAPGSKLKNFYDKDDYILDFNDDITNLRNLYRP